METIVVSAECGRDSADEQKILKTNQAHLIKMMLFGNYLMETFVLMPSVFQQLRNWQREKLRVQQMPQAEQNEANASGVRRPNVNMGK